MEQNHNSPEPLDERTAPVLSEVEGPALTTSRPAARHDGWSGDKMAQFCEVLADTAVVAEACDQAGMGMSGAYALRRRNAFFAAAWDSALTIARERLADTLLARSMEGNIEQIWRDGVVVGERHTLDNRLGLAILRRLDRLSAGEMPGASRTATSKPAPRCISFDWELMVDALRTADPDAIATSLAMLKGHEVEEVEGPPGHSLGASGGGSSPNSRIDDDEDEGIDLSDRCWKDGIDDIWMTDFPPPQGFSDYQSGPYGSDEERYVRACTDEESAILDADEAADAAAERAEDERMRDAWFAALRDDPLPPEAIEEAEDEPDPSATQIPSASS